MALRDLIVGEVSSVNDGNIDEHFDVVREHLSEIGEDEPIVHPFCNEYDKFI